MWFKSMNLRTILSILLNSAILCVLAFLLYKLTLRGDNEYRTVDTKFGRIRGIRKTSLLKNVKFYAFKGIPYAKSPTGDLRFKAPEPIEPWTPTVLDAFEHKSTCICPDVIGLDKTNQSEDCLVLNIYVPAAARTNNKLAVMFWIHGGAFYLLSGNDDLFGPDFLIEQQVIVVTFNYRLGIFGFLSLDTPEYSGNMGLKDQQMALKWIYENIDQFNGDKNRITIFGESAGGASTHFQVLSTESRKFFRNAIVMSGTAENIWSMSNEKHHLNIAYEMAERFGISNHSLDQLIEFLKTAAARDIVNSISYFDIHFGTFRLKFAPVVERKDARMPFLTETPDEIYKTSNIDKDIIYHHTSSEMLVFFKDIYVNFFGSWEPEANITLYLPFRGFDFPMDSKEYHMLEGEVRQFYFGNAIIDDKTTMNCVDMLSDSNFVYPNYKSMETHLKFSKSRVFYMRFSVDWTLNMLKRKFYGLNSGTPGASHADEICYLFKNIYCQAAYEEILMNRTSQQSKLSLAAIENITKLFTNFAQFGQPTYKDDPISNYTSLHNEEIMVLDINNRGLKVMSDPRKSANELWSRLEGRARQLIQLKNSMK